MGRVILYQNRETTSVLSWSKKPTCSIIVASMRSISRAFRVTFISIKKNNLDCQRYLKNDSSSGHKRDGAIADKSEPNLQATAKASKWVDKIYAKTTQTQGKQQGHY